MSNLLVNKISSARRKHNSVALMTAASSAALFVVMSAGIAMWVDYYVELPWLVRLMLVVLYVAGTVNAVVWYAFLPIVRGPDDDDIALAVERHQPNFATRLIAAVQFARLESIPAGMNGQMVRALIDEAEQLAGPVEFTEVVSTQRMWQLASGAVGAVVVVATCLGLAGPTGAALLQRAALFNTPLPRLTQVEVVSGDLRVARGETVTLSAIARGVEPDTGSVRLRFASGSVQKFDLRRDADSEHPERYQVVIDSVLEPFEYDVYLNDGRSDRAYNVQVIERPAVASLDVKQVYPAYTKLGVVPRDTADLTLLSGSRLQVNVVATKPLMRATSGVVSRLTFTGTLPTDAPTTQPTLFTRDVTLTPDPTDPTKLSTETPVDLPEGVTGFTVNLVDDTGMESRDPAVYRILIVPDVAPTLAIISPTEREQTVTRRAFIPISFVAADDFALAGVRVHHRLLRATDAGNVVAEGENAIPVTTVQAPVTTVELALTQDPRTLRGVYRLQLANLSPQPLEGDLIEWWLNATDANNATGPGKILTEVYRARVISEDAKRSELLAKFGESGELFQNLAESQQTVNEKLGEAILDTSRP